MAEKHSRNFLLGNLILAVAFVVLLAMGMLWEAIGAFAMVLWVLLVAAGLYLLISDRSEPPTPL